MRWNKITVNNFKIILSNSSACYLNIAKDTNLEIIVKKNIQTKLVLLGERDYQIKLYLEDNSSLIINSLNYNNSVDIQIDLAKDSQITYNHSVLCKDNSINYFKVNHLANNSQSILNNNGINVSSGKLFFNIDGVIPQKRTSILCNQNSKIINFQNGNSQINPNLIIDSHDICANHSAYIGKIGDEEKFYLASRGIGYAKQKELIYKAVLLGKMELLEEKEEFNKKLNEWW